MRSRRRSGGPGLAAGGMGRVLQGAVGPPACASSARDAHAGPGSRGRVCAAGPAGLPAGALLAGLLVAAGLSAVSLAGERGRRGAKPEKEEAKKEAEKEEAAPPVRVVGTVICPPRLQTRRESSAEVLLSPEVRAMIGKSLDYLQKSQHPNGAWGDTRFPESAGVTALACLALMSEGSQPNVGRYGRDLTKGLEFLLDHAKDDGQIVAKDTYRYGPMYDHAWATLCLLQAYGTMPWRRDFRDKLARAIQILLRYQKLDGGWRYKMMKEGESDSLVTLNVIFALRIGIKAGFAVPQKSLDRAVAFIRSNGIPDGRWYYKKGGRPGTVAISGCGVIAIYGSGAFDDPLVKVADDYILRYYQRYSVQDLLETPYVIYGSFYTSQAMYMAGDKYWVPWYQKTVQLFNAAQKENGEFYDQHGNKVYPTAMAAIVLQAPYGYLPLYQR